MLGIKIKKIIITTLIILIAIAGIGTNYASDVSVGRITVISDKLTNNSEAECKPTDNQTTISPCVCIGVDIVQENLPARGFPFQATYIGACSTDEKSSLVFILNDALWVTFAAALFCFFVLKQPAKTSPKK